MKLGRHLPLLVGLPAAFAWRGQTGAAESSNTSVAVGAMSTAARKTGEGGGGGAGCAPEAPKITSVSPAVAPIRAGSGITVVLRGSRFGKGEPRVRYRPPPSGEAPCNPSYHDEGEIVCSIEGPALQALLPNEPLHFIVSAMGVDGHIRGSEPSSDTLTPLTPAVVTEACWGERPTGTDVQLRLRGREFVVNKSGAPLVDLWDPPETRISCKNVAAFGTDDLVCYLPSDQRRVATHIAVQRPGEPPIGLSAAVKLSTLTCTANVPSHGH